MKEIELSHFWLSEKQMSVNPVTAKQDMWNMQRFGKTRIKALDHIFNWEAEWEVVKYA